MLERTSLSFQINAPTSQTMPGAKISPLAVFEKQQRCALIASFIPVKSLPFPPSAVQGEATEAVSVWCEWQRWAGISLYIDCNCFSLLMRLSSPSISLLSPVLGRFQQHKVVALRQPQLGFIVPAGQRVRHTSQLLFLRNKWTSHALIYGLLSQTLP